PDRPSPEAMTPVRSVIHASHPSYLPIHFPVLTHQPGIGPFKIYLVPRNSYTPDIDQLSHTLSKDLVEGRLPDMLKLFTPANLASFQMDAGTELLTADGTQLVGRPNLVFSHWEGGTTNGLKFLPGGQLAMDTAGNPGQIYLAGSIYLDIVDRDSRLAARVSQPIQCSMLISPSVYHPSTKAGLVAGDRVPVWFMNSESGIWESRETTTLDAFQNKLLANVNLDKPGMYLIGWINKQLCPAPLILRPSTLNGYQEIPYAFNLSIFEVYGDALRFIRTAAINGLITRDDTLRYLPDDSELVFRFESYADEDRPYYKNPDPVLLSGFCESGSPVEFDLLPKPNGTFKKIEVVFIDTQHNNTRYYPNVFPGYYRKNGTDTWQSTFVYDGQAYMINPQEGDLYQMGINFKGRFHSKEVIVGAGEVVLVEIEID
ncbi:MAG: hypothetical protein WCW62_16600, partial [Bacteroidales bacterium]